MATLTETAAVSRKVIALSTTTIVVGTLLWFGWGIGTQIYRQMFPPPPPAPTVAFDKLPPLPLRKLPLREGSAPTYQLETVTGQLPSFPDRFKIYQITQPPPSLLAANQAESLAKGLAFITEAKILSSDQYVWEDLENSRTLKMNILTKNFTIKTDWKRVETQPGQLPTEEELKQYARTFFSSRGLLDELYASGEQTVTLLKLEQSQLSRAVSLSEADLARVDLFRFMTEADGTQTPILGPNPREGLINAITTGQGETATTYPQITYFYQTIDLERSSTYPLKNIADAWQELQNGQGVLTYLRAPESNPTAPYTPLGVQTILIHEIYLAYFENTKAQEYLQPVYVFEGTAKLTTGELADYISYLPALSPEWVEQE